MLHLAEITQLLFMQIVYVTDFIFAASRNNIKTETHGMIFIDYELLMKNKTHVT